MKILKIPLNAGGLSKKQGLEIAPNIIEKQVSKIYLTETGALPLCEFEEVQIDNTNLTNAHDEIYQAVKKEKNYCILIGGDHSLTVASSQ